MKKINFSTTRKTEISVSTRTDLLAIWNPKKNMCNIGSINDSDDHIEGIRNFRDIGSKEMRASFKSEDDNEDSIYSSTPRIKDSSSEDNQPLNSIHNSNGQAFQLVPENSRQLPHERTSSIESSSKTSVGFLNDFYFHMVELIKYRNVDKLKQELLNNDDVYGPIDLSQKVILHYA